MGILDICSQKYLPITLDIQDIYGDREITDPLDTAFMLSVYHALIVAASNIDNAAYTCYCTIGWKG